MLTPYLVIAALVLGLGLPALFYCWTAAMVHPPSVLLWMVTVFFAYSAARLLALTYVATFFGPFDPRIIFSTYTAALIFCSATIAEAVRLHFLASHESGPLQPER
jgi:NO-binding membrane sensor protein with MHYT domain